MTAHRDMGTANFGVHSEEIVGSPTEKFLVFIDLWGMTEMIAKAGRTGDLLDVANVVQVQSRFWSLLGVKAQHYPQVEIISASDAAYLVGDDPAVLIEIVNDFFCYLSVLTGPFHLIPLRAAMSAGLRRLPVGPSISSLQNFKFAPYIGEAFVKTYKMEKGGPAGMRFFVTESARQALGSKTKFMISPESVGKVAVKDEPGEDYFEVNWLERQYLNCVIRKQPTQVTFGAEIESVASLWKSRGNRYMKDVGSGILDLITWTNGKYVAAPKRKKGCWLSRALRC